MPEWSNFFVATVSASAALLGLIFLGISINLKQILSARGIDLRASITMILLMGVLLISILLLVPTESIIIRGLCVLITGFTVWLSITLLDGKIYRGKPAIYKKLHRNNIVFTQLASLPYLVSGILLIAHNSTGMYWLVAAIIFSIIKAVLDAWVLLVEINR